MLKFCIFGTVKEQIVCLVLWNVLGMYCWLSVWLHPARKQDVVLCKHLQKRWWFLRIEFHRAWKSQLSMCHGNCEQSMPLPNDSVLDYSPVLRAFRNGFVRVWNLVSDIKGRIWPPLWSSGQSSWLHNGDVFWFLWGTNWIYICYVEESRPPLWSSGQSFWLQIQRSGFDSLRYQIFWEVVGLERGPLNLVSTIEELLGRKSSSSGLENREYGHRNPSRCPRGTLSPLTLALISPKSCGRSVGIVRSRI
jgi:hypothetical protein